MEKHIEKVINKTKYLIFILHQLTNIMSYESLMMIYYAFFHSAINYGYIAWGGAYNNKLQILQRLQIRLLKIIEKNKFITLKTTPNLINSLLHHYDKLSTEYSMSNSITRNKNLTVPNRYKRVSSKNSYVKALVLFNALPKELKELKSAKLRKKKIKKWIFYRKRCLVFLCRCIQGPRRLDFSDLFNNHRHIPTNLHKTLTNYTSKTFLLNHSIY